MAGRRRACSGTLRPAAGRGGYPGQARRSARFLCASSQAVGAAQSVRLQQFPDNFEHDFLIAGLGRQRAAHGIGGKFLGGDGA